MKKYLLLVLFFVFEFANANDCQKKQGVFDFGSGTTKAFVALVDVCEKRIVETLFEERIPLSLNEALEKSVSNEIPLSVIDEKLPALQGLVNKIKKDHGTNEISGVATSVFRVSKNGSKIAKMLSEKLNFPIEVISQEKEAELGYWSALAQQKTPTEIKNLIVWDIGGGSMQMYTHGPNKKVIIYMGNLASVTFKNKILEVLQFKNPKEFSSPNPIGNQRLAAIQLAKNHAYLNVPSYFKKNAEKSLWIGVGGVLSMSIQNQINAKAKEFSQIDLAETLKVRALLKDAEIQSDYRISEVSNLALVLGYMQALGIKKIETVQASLGQGLLYYNLNH
ncbi:MAG: Ppx/GppA phosphatase family protein [Bdellovibrio sp.]